MEHPNAEAYRRTADAFRAGYRDALAGLIDEDVVWHVPGMSPLAGEIHGREALFRFFDRLHEVTDGTFMLKEHDVLATDDHVVVGAVTGTGRGAGRLGGLLRLTQNGNPQFYLTGLLAGVLLISLGVVILR